MREGVSAQIDQAYINGKTLLEQAGASWDDVLHFWVFMKEELDIDTLVEKWLGVFPSDGDRPARKSFLRADIQGDQQVHMQLTAVLGSGKRSNYEVAGVHHRDPIPMGARIGDLFMSSGVFGIRPDPNDHTPGGKPAEGLPAQLTYGFANIETMMIENGGTLEDVAHLGILIKDYADRQADPRGDRPGVPGRPAAGRAGPGGCPSRRRSRACSSTRPPCSDADQTDDRRRRGEARARCRCRGGEEGRAADVVRGRRQLRRGGRGGADGRLAGTGAAARDPARPTRRGSCTAIR